MKNSRNIDDLHPRVAAMCHLFVKKCTESGIDVLITSTYRDSESQQALYEQGRTKPGKVVTNARPGQSFHNYLLAFDFVPVVNGKINWNDANLFRRCGVIGEQCGLEWAGRWPKFKEMAHLQFTGGLTLRQLQNGATIAPK